MDECRILLASTCWKDTGAAAAEANRTMACVLLMVKDDAPKDLVMTDPGLYQVLRKRITDARLGAWVR